jgi:topoisomerase-4 subunit A
LNKSQARFTCWSLIKAISFSIGSSKSSKPQRQGKRQGKPTEKFEFSERRASSVMLQLYKLSNTDISTLVKEKDTLEKTILKLQASWKIAKNWIASSSPI